MSYVICLDAGHGKETPGKRSFDQSLFEWEFNRDVANRLQKHLVRHGLSVMLTAPTEKDITLSNRVLAANKLGAALFVSIHANAYGTNWNDANGWEIYYSKGSAKGKILADVIHSYSIPYLGLKDRGVKSTEEFAVVRKTTMPAVLIEHGFYTNLKEVALLKTSDFREKCAIADAKGILQYLGIAWIEEKNTQHWAQRYVDSLIKKGILKPENIKQGTLDETITKGEVYQLLDKITDMRS